MNQLLTSHHTRKLPRWVLCVLIVLYLVPGQLERDPWKSDDAAGLGNILTMVNGGFIDWILPNVAKHWSFEDGPLIYWIGACFIKLLGIGDAALVARLAPIICIFLSCIALWYASYRLNHRPEMQPADPLGAAPSNHAFARAIADSTILILLASAGLILRSHETISELGNLFSVSLALAGSTLALTRPGRGGIVLGLALSCAFFSGGIPITLALLIGVGLYHIASPRTRYSSILTLSNMLWIATASITCWVYLVSQQGAIGQYYLNAWWQGQLSLFGLSPFLGNNWRFYLNTLLYLWPTWPIAAWSIYSLWHKRHEAPIAIALAYSLATLLLQLFLNAPSETTLLSCYPALALLAAFGLPTIKRSTVSLIDWFAVMTFTTISIALWFLWFAHITGTPPKIAYNIQKLAPEFKGSFVWGEFVLALLASIAWILVVRWRTQARPSAIWRPMVLSSAGMILTWSLLMTLWLPWINSSKTYRTFAQQLNQQLPKNACIDTQGLGQGQRASLLYFINIKFGARWGENGDEIASPIQNQYCDWLLVQQSANQTAQIILPPNAHWQSVWQGRRASDRHEKFVLFQKVK